MNTRKYMQRHGIVHRQLMHDMYGLTMWTGYESRCQCPMWTVKPCRSYCWQQDWGYARDHVRRWKDANGNRVLTWEPYRDSKAVRHSLEHAAAIGGVLDRGVSVTVCTGSPYVTAVYRVDDPDVPIARDAVVIFRAEVERSIR